MNNLSDLFLPDYTPYEIIKQGSYGGTYFRPIHSTVTGKNYKDADLEFDWGGIPRSKLIKPWNQYDTNINKYKCKVGTTLEFWESKGWIHPQDPYGWFQWYCRYYAGRRTDDDLRQIKRWISIKNRFGKLKNKTDDISCHPLTAKAVKTPAIKQTLLHWGIAS